MLSRRCRSKNEVTIPHIFSQWATMPSGEGVIDMSSAESWLMRRELVSAFTGPGTLASLEEKVRKHTRISGHVSTASTDPQLTHIRPCHMPTALGVQSQQGRLWHVF
jgi:hypothetical protein